LFLLSLEFESKFQMKVSLQESVVKGTFSILTIFSPHIFTNHLLLGTNVGYVSMHEPSVERAKKLGERKIYLPIT